jgi:hypothetical protein
LRNKLSVLKDRIETELRNIEESAQKASEAWEYAEQFAEQQRFYFDSVALNLHSFYSGLEHIFEMVARQIDSVFPSGDRWHQDLLEQMTKEIKELRPAVISLKTFSLLDDFLAFRHLVRSIYAFNLDAEKLKQLLVRLPEALYYAKQDLRNFCELLSMASDQKG